MNDIINNILSRRSVKSFSDKAVSKEDIEVLIKTGLYAPSGMNMQTWNFIGVLNSDKIAELANAVGKALNRENYNFYKSTALIIISNEKDSIWGREDNACAMQNIMLAAHSMGIGSVWINQLNEGNCNISEIRKILDSIGVPESHSVYGIAALGYSDKEPRGIIDKKGQFSIIE